MVLDDVDVVCGKRGGLELLGGFHMCEGVVVVNSIPIQSMKDGD